MFESPVAPMEKIQSPLSAPLAADTSEEAAAVAKTADTTNQKTVNRNFKRGINFYR